jgi:hypothetical protein
MTQNKFELKPSYGSQVSVTVGPVWTTITVKVRTDRLLFHGRRQKTRRPKGSEAED